MTAPKHRDSIGVKTQSDPKTLLFIKSEMLRIEADFTNKGVYATLRLILRSMEFWVHEELGAILLRELIDEGLMPPRRKRKKFRGSYQRTEGEKYSYLPDTEVISKVKREIKTENAIQMGCLRAGEAGLAPALDSLKDREEILRRREICSADLSRMTPRQASVWARKRYSEAWKSIQGIPQRRCQEETERLMASHVTGVPYAARGSSDFGREGRFVRTVDGP